MKQKGDCKKAWKGIGGMVVYNLYLPYLAPHTKWKDGGGVAILVRLSRQEAWVIILGF